MELYKKYFRIPCSLLKVVAPVLFFILALSACDKVSNKMMVGHRDLNTGWQMQSSTKVVGAEKEVSSPDFDTKDWYNAGVPGTVLGSLVADSVYTDVFSGRNLNKIPDSLFSMPWWYRTIFKIEKHDSNQVVRLRFNGINYRADIWLNGMKIASADSIEGGFRRFTFNVSKEIKSGDNVLALKITRPHPGDLTVGFVDWNPEPPDHSMGIWRNVELMSSGPVFLDAPFVQTKVDTATLDHAWITVSSLLHNTSDATIKGVLKGTIGKDISFSKEVVINAGETKEVVFDPKQFAQLSLAHPRLWWVHTWGKPNLYDLHLQFESGQAVSDTSHIRFGIRQVSDYFTKDGFRGFKLNGRKILIKGGGWTDPMLLNASPAYEEAGIDYAVHMNLNTLRMEGFWGHDQHLYDLCDEKGILLMAGFSCQWEWTEYLGTEEDEHSAIITPKQNDIAAKSWQDQIIWLRNHPSIFLWLYGSDKQPRPSLEKQYLATLKKYDNTRPAISSAADYTPGVSSAPSHVSSISGPTGVKMRGPYDYVPPVYWYIDTANGGAFGFNTETSPGPEIPVLESLKKMIPADSLWPMGSAWLYHAARHNFYNFTYYNQAITKRLGPPEDLKDYLRKAQYINYEGMRAMFEAFEANRCKATGIIQWMYNASWPKLWWQLYDYYLMPTAAFYGARKANEPIHISYNYGKKAVDVINNIPGNVKNMSAEITVLDFNLKQHVQKNIAVTELASLKTQSIFSLPEDPDLTKTWFLDLKLYDQQHHILSSNFYVLSTQKDRLNEAKTTWFTTPQSQYADLKMLQQLPTVKLQVNSSFSEKKDSTFATVKVKNPSKYLAFMVYLDLKKNKSDASVVPVFWEDNYITLLPGEQRTVSVYCHTRDLHNEQPVIKVAGWNIE